jgi:chromosome segregation ATPase
MGRAELKGKDEPIDLYAVAWSESATQQLIEQVQAKYEQKIKELKKQQEQLEEDLEIARDQWRNERRNLNAEIEQLEENVEQARQAAKAQASEDLQSEIRFQLDEAIRARQQMEEDLASAQRKFESEKNSLRSQITSMQASAVESMERSNNPARLAMMVNEKLEAKMKEAKEEWQLQAEGEKKRLTAEIERLKKANSPSAMEEKKEAARRAILEKMGKLPAGSAGPATKTADQWQKEFEDAKIGWDTEKEQLNLKVTKLEMELQRATDTMRTEIFQEMRGQYEPKMVEANRDRQRLQQEVQSLTADLASERQRFNERIEHFEKAMPEAQEAARKQALAELQTQFDVKLEEANRIQSRMGRKHQDTIEQLEAELRRAKKQITGLEEQLKEAKEAAYKAQKAKS